jgi:hypothetical protein
MEKLGHKYLDSLLKRALKQPGLKKSFPKNMGKKKVVIELSLARKGSADRYFEFPDAQTLPHQSFCSGFK